MCVCVCVFVFDCAHMCVCAHCAATSMPPSHSRKRTHLPTHTPLPSPPPQTLQVVPEYVTKIIQIFDCKVARHGNMIVGRTGSGKSTAWKALTRAMARLRKEDHPDERFQKVRHCCCKCVHCMLCCSAYARRATRTSASKRCAAAAASTCVVCSVVVPMQGGAPGRALPKGAPRPCRRCCKSVRCMLNYSACARRSTWTSAPIKSMVHAPAGRAASVGLVCLVVGAGVRCCWVPWRVARSSLCRRVAHPCHGMHTAP